MANPTSSIPKTLDPVCGMTVDPATAKHAHQRRFLANFVALLHAPLLRHRLDSEQEETKRDDQNLYELVKLEFHVCDLE